VATLAGEAPAHANSAETAQVQTPSNPAASGAERAATAMPAARANEPPRQAKASAPRPAPRTKPKNAPKKPTEAPPKGLDAYDTP
jgi:hypothetical protein